MLGETCDELGNGAVVVITVDGGKGMGSVLVGAITLGDRKPSEVSGFGEDVFSNLVEGPALEAEDEAPPTICPRKWLIFL